MAATKKGLGRGLSALIPDEDMEFLSRVARGDASLSVTVREAQPTTTHSPARVSSVGGKADSIADIGAKGIEEATASPDLGGKTQSKPTAGEASDGEASDREASAAKEAIVTASGQGAVWVNVSTIEANPYQPRRVFADEEMRDLVASVSEHGIIQPILVRPQENAEKPYQLIAGERRWRAAQQAGLDKVPVVIRPVNDQQALELALIENVQRHDISVIDAARAYRRLGQEFSLSQEEIAKRVGKSRPSISNTMRLLDLPQEAQQALEDGSLSEGHGRAILLAPGEGARRAVFRLVIRDKLTVREAEEAARRALTSGEDATSTKSDANTSADKGEKARLSSAELKAIRVTEEELSKTLGTRVRIRPRAKGGQVSIEYYSPEDLDQLLAQLRRITRKAGDA